jgi:hypothetical protein
MHDRPAYKLDRIIAVYNMVQICTCIELVREVRPSSGIFVTASFFYNIVIEQGI